MIHKTCSSCGQSKPRAANFAFRKKASGIRRNDCKDCYNEKKRQRHKTSEHAREVSRISRKKRRAESRVHVYSYLASHPCVDCGESDPVVLEFDHVRGVKAYNVSYLMQNFSIKAINEEIAKCDVRCANCHRRITASRKLEKALSVRAR